LKRPPFKPVEAARTYSGSSSRYGADARLRRIRSLAWLLDRSIPIGGGRRIGLDPIIGLLPGAGDWLGAALSFYVLYQGARLGVPRAVLGRMAGNILVEAVVGAVPVLGDLFDFVWQANHRNLKLVEQAYRPTLRPRSFREIWLVLALFAVAFLGLLAALLFFVIKGIAAVLA
jgi:hypothetical protein